MINKNIVIISYDAEVVVVLITAVAVLILPIVDKFTWPVHRWTPWNNLLYRLFGS